MKPKDIVVHGIPGLTPDQEDEAWAMYEDCGNMAEVARSLGCSYHSVRSALGRDPIRMQDTHRVRAEQVARRWEGQEERCALVGVRLLNILDGIISHIDQCKLSHDGEGEAMTSLVDGRDHKRSKMSVTQAYQWLMETRQLDTVGKLAFTAAKIAEGMRQISMMDASGKRGAGIKDPSKMTDDELRRLVADMEAAGSDIPWGVRQWQEQAQK